ncbi:N-acetylmuramoyl-L-alanine amidase [Candidatus Gracilibacteria bacterium]|nr:N-acetylmuramoyl-L-alanine amidase [Candidatus Gracilibacteria bacterium]MCF7855939.1 N-acetylmuramoyl-L-alanine amidase [Candidatus Gracilibacteria bacterium]MCF7896368.1 N-acetylmuramoyl-L-alanine amidase [Candidatus Gracilibacteria bacterium]
MKKFFLIFGFVILLSACQSFDLATLEVVVPANSAVKSFTSPIVPIAKFNAFFFKFQKSGIGEADLVVWFQETAGSGQLTRHSVELECEDLTCTGIAITPLAEAYKFQIELTGESGFQVDNFAIETKNISTKSEWNFIPTAQAQISELGIISRSEWGADENYLLKTSGQTAGTSSSVRAKQCAEWLANNPEEFAKDSRKISVNAQNQELQWPREYSPEIKKIVIHATATDGEKDVNGDSKVDEADTEAMVRAIYYYHAVWNGWGDIGYHYLIDTFGNVYEGKSGGDFVIGAHAYCGNTGTIGVSFIGDYQTKLPSEAALNSAEKLLGELANLYSLELDKFSNWHDKNSRNLIGHRDVVATICPGESLYAHLPELAVAAMNYARGNKISDADYDFRIMEKDSPVYLKPFEVGVANFQLKNTGKKAWEVGSKIQVAKAEMRRNKVGVAIADGGDFAVTLSSRVDAGATANLKIPLKTSATPGRYRFGLIPNFGGEDLRKFYLVVNVLLPEKLDYELLETQWPPQPFAPYSTAEAWVTLKNKSDFTWQASGENRMVLQTADGNISPFTASAIVGYLEADTPPGGVGKFKMQLTAPKAGRYYLEFKPAARGGLQLPDYGMQFHISVREPRFSGDLTAKSSGSSLRFEPGETKKLFIDFRNTSQIDWTPNQFKLDILQNEGVRLNQKTLRLPQEVKQNAAVRIEFAVTASNRAGKYLLTLQPSWSNGKTKQLKPIDFLVEVNPPRLTGKIISQPETFYLDKLETAEVTIQIENTGNVVWNSRDTLLQTLPVEESSLAVSSWLSPLQPAKLKEEVIKPGEVGTFAFTIRKNSAASNENLQLVPMVRGLGRIRGKAVQLSVRSYQLAEKQNIEIKEEPINEEKSEILNLKSSMPMIRIKLGFAAPKIEIGGGNFAIEQFEKTLFRGSFADFSVAKLKEGEYFSIFPEGETMLEIPNWSRPNWNGSQNYNKFRGVLEVRREGDNLVLINELPLEKYLWGIAEPAPTDPIEKKKLMALLARSYALYYTDSAHRKFPGKSWDGSDSPAEFQQYLGYNYEIAGSFREFVEATEGEVVTFDGAVVKTPYFTSSDGITKSAAEAGWNIADFKFIKKVEDPWSCGGNSDSAGVRCVGNARGHGVGVSGKGAAGLAREGKTALEILNYFFENVEVEKVY